MCISERGRKDSGTQKPEWGTSVLMQEENQDV